MQDDQAENVKRERAAAQAEAWAGVTTSIDGDSSLPPGEIISTVDVPNCPQCGSVAKRLGDRDRACMGCGFAWKVLTERDELDQKADRATRSRSWSEERGGGRPIGKGATRW